MRKIIASITTAIVMLSILQVYLLYFLFVIKFPIFLNKTTVLTGQNEGLPNITGSITSDRAMLAGDTNIDFDGAFSGELTSSNLNRYDYGSTPPGGSIIKFNASKANPIYDNSTHVTPSNLSIKVWQRIS